MSAQLQLDGITPAAARPPPVITRQERVLQLVLQHAQALRYVGVDWMRANWKIWEAFEREADDRYREGQRAWGSRTIGEYIRRETRIQEQGGKFKVNDHIWPDLARLYLMLKPERDGFFELRGRAP